MDTDFIIGSDGDIEVNKGDFVIDISDEQHVWDILSSKKGEYKQSPVVGVDIIRFFHGPFTAPVRERLRREILVQLETDGLKGANVQIDVDGNITVNGIYLR